MPKARPRPTVGSIVLDVTNDEGGVALIVGPQWCSFMILADRYGGPRMSAQLTKDVIVYGPPLPRSAVLALMAVCGMPTRAQRAKGGATA